MEYRAITLIVMGSCALVLIGWDIVVAFFNKVPNTQDTISGISYSASLYVWTIPYAFGVLGGHLFMPGVFLESVRWWGMTALVGFGIAIGVFGIAYGTRINQVKWRVAIRAYGVLNAGIVMGWLCWPQ